MNTTSYITIDEAINEITELINKKICLYRKLVLNYVYFDIEENTEKKENNIKSSLNEIEFLEKKQMKYIDDKNINGKKYIEKPDWKVDIKEKRKNDIVKKYEKVNKILEKKLFKNLQECIGRKSKTNPNGISKEELIKVMLNKKSIKDKLPSNLKMKTKDELCKILFDLQEI